MKREKIRTYVVDKWGRIEDLKAKVYYYVGLPGEFAGRRVFIGKCPYDWFLRNDKSRYIAFNLDGSFFKEVDRFEMDDFDIKMSRNNKKYKKIIEDIETLKRLQAEYKEMCEVGK